MIIRQTKLTREDAKLPTIYEFLKTQHIRGLLQTEAEIRKFRNIEAGVIGEQKMLDFLEKYGRDHWEVLCNVWLNDSGSFECDLLLMTSQCIYLLEIKNHTGRLVYEDGACSLNNYDLATNPVHQTRRAFRGLKNILRRYSKQLNIKAALIFIGECNQVVLKDSVDEFHILQLTDIYQFIKHIKAEEDNHQYYAIEPSKIIQHLEKFEVSTPFVPTPLNKSQLENIKRGVSCKLCKSFKIKVRKNNILCPCGLHEPREQAIVRAACEYGVLYSDQEYFTVSDISKFVGAQASDDYIRKVLKEHFKQDNEPHDKTLKFHSPKQLFESIQPQFHFNKPTLYHTKNSIISQLI